MKIDREKLLASAPEGYFWQRVDEQAPFPNAPVLVIGCKHYELRPQQRAVDWDKVSDDVMLYDYKIGAYYTKLMLKIPIQHVISSKSWIKSDICPFDPETCNYETYNTAATVEASETTFWRFTGLQENCEY